MSPRRSVERAVLCVTPDGGGSGTGHRMPRGCSYGCPGPASRPRRFLPRHLRRRASSSTWSPCLPTPPSTPASSPPSGPTASRRYASVGCAEVGVSEPYVGTVDVEHRIDRRAFFPDQSVGGRNIHRRGINLDSGILNPDLIDDRTDPALSSLWRKARLRDRADAVIAHELEEASGTLALQHEEATQKAADTRLLISDAARLLLRVAAGRNR